jgi:fluoroquinolone transport system permease protein
VSSRLLRALKWDLRLQLRYHVATAAAVVTLLYVALFRAVPAATGEKPLVLLLVADPSVLGFLFVGVLVLFERGSNTLQAVVATPLSFSEYLLAKAFSLTLLATASGFVMALAARGTRFGSAQLLAAMVLTSLLFVFLGIVGVSYARSVNAYLLLVPVALMPLNLPMLGFVGVFDSPLLFLIPTRASLALFQSAFGPRPAWELVYAALYLPAAVVASFFWARHAFERSVRGPEMPL